MGNEMLEMFRAATTSKTRELTDGAIPCGMTPEGCTGFVTLKWQTTVADKDGAEHQIGLCPRITEHRTLTTATSDTKKETARATVARASLRGWLDVNRHVQAERAARGDK
jgi:hypothetical protein